MTAAASDVLLALDTATSHTVVALGDRHGDAVAVESWPAAHRHGEELLPRLRALLARAGRTLDDVVAIVVGTGPGAFTGLRVGLATAKALAVGLDRPIVGIATSTALLAADELAGHPAGAGLLLPAGPSDRVLVLGGEARLLTGAAGPEAALEGNLVAVDLAGRAPGPALARGAAAQAGLGAALLRLGARRLEDGHVDDVARLVPHYVTLPRGIREEVGEVAWSHGRP